MHGEGLKSGPLRHLQVLKTNTIKLSFHSITVYTYRHILKSYKVFLKISAQFFAPHEKHISYLMSEESTIIRVKQKGSFFANQKPVHLKATYDTSALHAGVSTFTPHSPPGLA